jgi:hypothetical protein
MALFDRSRQHARCDASRTDSTQPSDSKHNSSAHAPLWKRSVRWGVPAMLMLVAGVALVTSETTRFAIAGTSTKMMTTSLDCPTLARMLLAQIGINPQVLAAVGATPEQTRDIVLAARGLCEARGGDFDAAEATVAEIQLDVSRMADRVQRGFAVEGEARRLESKRQELANALDARTEIQQQVRGVINSVLHAEQVMMLDNIIDADDVVVPVYWKVEPREERDWIDLRDRLAEARTQARAGTRDVQNPRGVEPPVDVSMSDAVMQAKSRVETQGRAVADAWRAALAN